ncbi:MAG: conjugal transfer protein [Moorellaceae bacterium]
MQNSSDVRVFSSYRSLFNIKYKMYNFGDWTLPFPIPLDALIVFATLLAPVEFISKPVAVFLKMPNLVAALSLDIAFTYLCMQWDPQGKMLPVFLAEVLAFFFRPKKRTFEGKVLWLRKERVTWEMKEIRIAVVPDPAGKGEKMYPCSR